jgi:molybdate transport system permease protein
MDPIIISLKVASISTIATLIIGIAAARLFTKHQFPFKSFFEVLMLIPMVLPPSVTGYCLLLIVGNRGPVGIFFSKYFGVNIVFTVGAACIAATVVSFPLMYQSVKASFSKIDPSIENAARTLGASEITVFFKVTIPMALPGILSGLALSFSRALGEFGATLMIAGNIPGKTQTIPVAMYYAVESGDTHTANMLLIFVFSLSFGLIYLMNMVQARNSEGDKNAKR